MFLNWLQVPMNLQENLSRSALIKDCGNQFATNLFHSWLSATWESGPNNLISPEQVNPWYEVLAASLMSIWPKHAQKKETATAWIRKHHGEYKHFDGRKMTKQKEQLNQIPVFHCSTCMLHTVPEYFLIRDQQKEKQALKICQHRYKERASQGQHSSWWKTGKINPV